MPRPTSINQISCRIFGVLVICLFLRVPEARSAVVTWKPDLSEKAHRAESKAFVELQSLLTTKVTDLQPLQASRQMAFSSTVDNQPDVKTTGSASVSKREFEINDDAQQITAVEQSQSAQPTNSINLKRDQYEFAVSSSPLRPNTELDEAMARSAFNEEFVSVPTIQFASMVTGSAALSAVSSANVGVVPVPELSAFFPIVGLIVAISCTQILRRRRVAQRAVLRRLV